MPAQEKCIRILIVEDHRVTLDGLDACLLQTENFEVVGKARDAKTAIETARLQACDVVLLDLHLPGEETVDETIKNLLACNSKIIMFSAEDRPHLVQLVMKKGVAAFLSKGEDYDVICRVIKDVAEGAVGYISVSLRKKRRRPMSPAEEEILIMLAHGKKYGDIADKRQTSPHTIRKQCDRLQLKLGLDSREALVVWAVENGYSEEVE